MRRKPKAQRERKRQTARFRAILSSPLRRRILRGGGVSALIIALALAGNAGMTRVEEHVHSQVTEREHQPVLAFIDLPQQVAELCEVDLRESLADLLTRKWTDDTLCREMAERVGKIGWVARVNFVRRTGDGRFEISARYRLPAAMVQHDGKFMLIDRESFRLPGTYLYTPRWKLIRGVEANAPPAGTHWDGKDIEAALNVIAAIANELFGDQVTTVVVDNVGGRRKPMRSHIELATDLENGRIRWGSAPGFEVEENTVEQKLAILRENFRRTGRADAGHSVIDISTFPDRFTIPG
jgi:hypothetical protein